MTTPLPTPTPGPDTSQVTPSTGTNATLSYSNPNATDTNANLLRVRVRSLKHSFEVIATESHARIHRAMYPHQRAVGRFALTFELKGYTEYNAFMTFMTNYMKTFFTVAKFSLLVNMPVRNFSQLGVPVHGVGGGDHVGSMVFKPEIVFESVHDPNDPAIYTPGSPNVATTDLAGVTGDQAKFFYPWSSGSLDANAKAETVYDFPHDPNLDAILAQPGTTGPNQGGIPGLGGYGIPGGF